MGEMPWKMEQCSSPHAMPKIPSPIMRVHAGDGGHTADRYSRPPHAIKHPVISPKPVPLRASSHTPARMEIIKPVEALKKNMPTVE